MNVRKIFVIASAAIAVMILATSATAQNAALMRRIQEHRRQVDEMLRTDPAFAEIIAFAKQLASEIEYDWSALNDHIDTYARQGVNLEHFRYRGAPIIRTPGMRYRECGGYAQEVTEKILSLNSVQTAEIWAGPGHVWNVLKLTDGRTLYFDVSGFDNEMLNHQTGRIEQLPDYNWGFITFDENLFRSIQNSPPGRSSFYEQRRLYHTVSRTNSDGGIVAVVPQQPAPSASAHVARDTVVTVPTSTVAQTSSAPATPPQAGNVPGTWANARNTERFVFNVDGTGVWHYDGREYNFVYTATSTNIVLTLQSPQGVITRTFRLQGRESFVDDHREAFRRRR